MVWYTLVLESRFSSAQTLETTGFRLSHTAVSHWYLTPLSHTAVLFCLRGSMSASLVRYKRGITTVILNLA